MSDKANPNLTKTCASCGLQKPLSAFLEMSSTEGTIYGNICSSCRKTTLEELERRKKADTEGSTTTESGNRIDANHKMQTTADKREHITKTDEKYHAERKVDEKISHHTQEKNFQIQKNQKQHHQGFLNNRPSLGSETTARKFGAAQQLRTEMAHSNEKAGKVETHAKKVQSETTHDFTKEQRFGDQFGSERFKGQRFREFIQYLANAPVAKTVNQTKKSEAGVKQTGSIAKSSQFSAAADRKKEEPAKDTAVEFIKKNWSPGSKR